MAASGGLQATAFVRQAEGLGPADQQSGGHRPVTFLMFTSAPHARNGPASSHSSPPSIGVARRHLAHGSSSAASCGPSVSALPGVTCLNGPCLQPSPQSHWARRLAARVARVCLATRTFRPWWPARLDLALCGRHRHLRVSPRGGTRGGQRYEALGHSRGGFGTRRHRRAEGNGSPSAFALHWRRRFGPQTVSDLDRRKHTFKVDLTTRISSV